MWYGTERIGYTGEEWITEIYWVDKENECQKDDQESCE